MEEKLAKENSHNNEPITLMLLGGGLRFPAYIGALAALEEKGLKIEKIVGASAGSIIGSLYAAGKSPLEMKKITLELDTTRFRDFSIKSLFRGKGLYEGKVFESWIDEVLNGRKFSDKFRIPLFVVAFDILNNTPVVFSRSNFPDLKVSTAIRFSIGIPWVFAYKYFTHTKKRHVFVDGILMSGLVEDMFEKEGKMLVLRVISKKSMAPPSSDTFTLKKYLQELLLIMMHAVESERVKADRWKDTILIFCGDIPPTKFSITAEEKTYLFEQGYIQVKKFLEYKWGI